MRVAIIGTGNIGRTLARRLASAGHQVALGSRTPGEGTVAIPAAIVGAQVVVLAMPGGAVDDFLAAHGDALAGRLVIDAANRIGGPGPAHSLEQVRSAAPAARYARAFNSLGWESLADPDYPGGTASGFFSCAVSDREVVAGLVGDVGLDPEWVGEDAQDVVDGVLRLWFALVIRQGAPRGLALRVIRR